MKEEEEESSNTILDIIATSGISLLSLNTLSNIKEIDRENKEDYLTLTRKNLDLIKQELYK